MKAFDDSALDDDERGNTIDSPCETQTWNAEAYAAHGRFVADLATAAVRLLSPLAGEHILDVGCGDGALTSAIATTGAHVVGLDRSPEMVRAARTRNLDVRQEEIANLSSEARLQLRDRFDAVFSNAALHWIAAQDQPAALRAVRDTLRPGGRFVAEMGGFGNIAAIRTALQASLAVYGVDAEKAASSFFPSAQQYARLLESTGFLVQGIALRPRPTPLPEGGMESWLNTFRNGVLNRLPAAQRAQAVTNTVELLRPSLCDVEGNWTADYVRLRFIAVRPS